MHLVWLTPALRCVEWINTAVHLSHATVIFVLIRALQNIVCVCELQHSLYCADH